MSVFHQAPTIIVDYLKLLPREREREISPRENSQLYSWLVGRAKALHLHFLHVD